MFGTRTGTHCTPKATHSRHFLTAASVSEAGVNSSLTDGVLRVETNPHSTLEAAGAFGTRLQEYTGIPIAAWWGSLSGMVYIT